MINYIYDILLNFKKDYYDFFEWNKNDEIIHMRKIPLFRVSDVDFLNFKNGIVCFEKQFLNLIYKKSEKFKRINVSALNYVFLVSNAKEVLGLWLDKNGQIKKKSSLLLDECDEIIDVVSGFKIYDFLYKSVNYEKPCFKTRKEIENGAIILSKLKKLYKNKDKDKLLFLYLECFGVLEKDENKIFNTLKKEVLNNTTSYEKILNFFKLIEQK